MFAVIFEVQPNQERWSDYLELAGILRPELEKIDGFIDNERFTGLHDRGRLLSLSTWRDEKALIRWRTLALHHNAQARGRSGIFADYHLRVGEVIADNDIADNEVRRASAPAASRRDRNRRRQAGYGQRMASGRRRRWRRAAGDPWPAGLGAGAASPRPRFSRASTTRASGCCWCRGRTAPPAKGGGRSCPSAANSATGRCASSATTACATAAKPRNTILRSPRAGPSARPGRGSGPPGPLADEYAVRIVNRTRFARAGKNHHDV